jgi:hypothetical protein
MRVFFMPTNYKILSIDESGKASYKHFSKLFVLSAVIVSENFKHKLDLKIRRLKKKYLGDDEAVFHSRDMSRKKGLFAVLRDKKTENDFWSELISILNNKELSFIFIITDKNKAKKFGWEPKTILKRSYFRIAELFLINLSKYSSRGKIIAESDPSQDLYLMQAHVFQQSQNLKYRQNVTSISFVKKSNLDIDVQIADSLAPIAGMIFANSKVKNRIDKIKMRLIERKLLDKDNPSYLESLV